MMKVVQTFNVTLMVERHLVEYKIIVTMTNIFRDNVKFYQFQTFKGSITINR